MWSLSRESILSNAYLLACLVVVMATSSSSEEKAVPFSAVPTINQEEAWPDYQVSTPTVPCSAVDGESLGTDASRHCSVSSEEDDEFPLSAIDVDGIFSDEAVIKDAKFRKCNDGKRIKSKKPKIERVVPNAFVALPIKSVMIRTQIEQLHQHLLSKEPKIQNLLVPINRMHITLMVIKLDSEDDIERARIALSQVSHLLLKEQSVVLKFNGLSSFGSKVLYAQVDEESEKTLRSIASQVRSTFEDSKVFSTDKRQFTPHMTIAKLSRQRRPIIKKINEDLYSDWPHEIGEENVKEIELLAMDKKDESGYYFCYGREKISKA